MNTGIGQAECCDREYVSNFNFQTNNFVFGVTESTQGNTHGARLLGFFESQPEYIVHTLLISTVGQTISVGSSLIRPNTGVQRGLRMLWFVLGKFIQWCAHCTIAMSCINILDSLILRYAYACIVAMTAANSQLYHTVHLVRISYTVGLCRGAKINCDILILWAFSLIISYMHETAIFIGLWGILIRMLIQEYICTQYCNTHRKLKILSDALKQCPCRGQFFVGNM